MADYDDDDDNVGYGRPPKQHRFKKGQSGCPDGGRKAKRTKREKAEDDEKEAPSPAQQVLAWFAEQRRVRVNGKVKKMTAIQLALHQLYEDVFVKRDPDARKLFFALARANGWLKAPPPRQPGTGVLVVYPTVT